MTTGTAILWLFFIAIVWAAASSIREERERIYRQMEADEKHAYKCLERECDYYDSLNDR